jgi:uroporphyrinogen decarboxylase
MVKLTERERMLRTYKRQEIDRVPMFDKAWKGTRRRWKNEGIEGWWEDYFGFDHLTQVRPDNSPRFETKVLEETDRYRIVTTPWGATQKQFKEMDSTPETLDFYYCDSDRWEEAKAKMLQHHEDRIPWEKLKQNAPIWEKEGRFRQLVVWHGFDVAHSGMIGTENVLIGMYEEPEWIKDVIETYLTTSLDLCQRILDAGYQFDGIFWYDDMGYKNTPFFSPEMYREIVKPFHKRAVDWAHERGLVTELHSCGFIEPLIPDILDTGVEMLNPLEIKAGMDPFKLKKLYGDKLAFHGGINAQLWDNIELVKSEMERIIPAMKEGGGYVFASDHSIPNSVSFENMKEIARLAHELGKYN